MNRSLSTRRHDDAPQGPSKIVYSWESDPFSTDHFDVISPKQLNDLMEEGEWTIVKQERRSIRHPTKGKEVKVDRLTLGKVAKTREVARRDDVDEMGNPTGRGLTQHGGGYQLSQSGSYLGGGSDFAGLGLPLASSKQTENAYGIGVDCAKTGGSRDDCPFPPSNKLYEQWQRGFAAGLADDQKQEVALDPTIAKEAYDLGKVAATGPEDLAVECPYPNGSAQYKQWLKGFADHGGKVE